MLRLNPDLTLDLDFRQKKNLFVVDQKVVTRGGHVHEVGEFLRDGAGTFFTSEEELSLLLSSFLLSIYEGTAPVEPLLDVLSEHVAVTGLIHDRRYYDVRFQFVDTAPVWEKNLNRVPFEYLFGSYTVARITCPTFMAEVKRICHEHFIYMTCGALNAMFTASFGKHDTVPDALETIFSDVIESPRSVIEILNHPYLAILYDDQIPINYERGHSVRYLLDTYGAPKLKDLWVRLLEKRLPAYVYREDPKFLTKMFDERVHAIETDDYTNFLQSDTGLRFSLYYSNVPEFRNTYNRSLIEFFHSTYPEWHL